MKICDLKDSPYKDSKAQNGFDSVSKGLVVSISTHQGVGNTPQLFKLIVND